jgi:hypothetical protein
MTTPESMTTPEQIITAENVTKHVKLYFESKRMTITASAFSKFCIAVGNDNYLNGNTSSLADYNVFWAIRLLAETGKYDYDDIEFHAKKNPIFAEIDSEPKPDEKKPNQVYLLRKAIHRYKQEAEKIERAEKKALADEKERAAYIDSTLYNASANRVRSLILIGSKL